MTGAINVNARGMPELGLQDIWRKLQAQNLALNPRNVGRNEFPKDDQGVDPVDVGTDNQGDLVHAGHPIPIALDAQALFFAARRRLTLHAGHNSGDNSPQMVDNSGRVDYTRAPAE